MKVHVMGPNLFPSDGHAFHVHAKDCADLTRKQAYRGREHDTDRTTASDFGSLEQIVLYVYDNGIMEDGESWLGYKDEFKVFPCVEDLPDTIVL